MHSPPAGDDSEALSRHAAWVLALQEVEHERRRLADDIDRMHRSLSWRLTAPLRRLRQWLQPASAAPAPLAGAQPGDASAFADASDLLRRCAGHPPVPAPRRPERLYVDVTELAREDAFGGIPRVSGRILVEWLLQPPSGWRVEPVRLTDQGHYVHARAYLGRLLGLPSAEAGADVAVAPAPGDVFIGLDLVREHAGQARTAVAALRARQVRIGFVLYDLLPLQHPDWFPPGTQAAFERWWRMVAEHADRVLCISEQVAGDARGALAVLARPGMPRVSAFPLGDDLHSLVPAGRRLAPRTPGRTRWLMVGTLEPRKAHAQALAAFEVLWARGVPVELVIAGRPGWCGAELLARLHGHRERGRRLHWLDGANDAELLAAYEDCDALLAASFGEGYGLPVVEAARMGLPILARDLPVFREIAGEGADYFRADDADLLAEAILAWIERRARGSHADPSRVPLHRWRDSAAALARELLAD